VLQESDWISEQGWDLAAWSSWDRLALRLQLGLWGRLPSRPLRRNYVGEGWLVVVQGGRYTDLCIRMEVLLPG